MLRRHRAEYQHVKVFRMAAYLAHTCPKCKDYLGVVVHELRPTKTGRAVRAVCIRCRYQLDWKLIPGRLRSARHPLRSTHPRRSEMVNTVQRKEQS
jgi:hypothetical protein